MFRKTTLNQMRWNKEQEAKREKQLKQQLAYLYFSSLEKYYQWCKSRNFKATLDKQAYVLKEERELRLEEFRLEEEKTRKSQADKKSQTKEIQLVLSEIDSALKLNPELKPAWNKISQLKHNCVFSTTTFIDKDKSSHNHFLSAYFKLAKHSSLFLIEPEKIKNKKSNPLSYFEEALDKLIVKYPLPKAFISWWFNSSSTLSSGYVDLVQGKKAYEVFKQVEPIPLTHRQINLILNKYGKQSYSYNKARLQAILETMKAPPALVNALVKENEFVNSLEEGFNLKKEYISYLIKNADFFDWSSTKELWDYILELKRQSDSPELFSLKNRSMLNLIQGMHTWHTGLMKSGLAVKDDRVWEKSHIKNYTSLIEETGESFKIEELLSGKQLFEEGKALSHCVYSYTNKCKDQQRAIFSLTYTESKDSFFTKQATIEVNLNTGIIEQFKGKKNTTPSNSAKFHMNQWADKNNLRVKP